MKIGIFDSGVGGLTVLKELRKYHPHHHYIYFGDNLNLPYGDKDKDTLIKLSDRIIKFLLKKDVDLIIIACGTISSSLSFYFQKKYPNLIIDVVSPTITYLETNKLSNLAVIATEGTIKSGVFSSLNLIARGCPQFAPLIESLQTNTSYFNKMLSLYLEPLKDVDILVLGCTHYPLIEKEISCFFNHKVNIINMGVLLAKTITFEKETLPIVELYFSKIDNNLEKLVYEIMGETINIKLGVVSDA